MKPAAAAVSSSSSSSARKTRREPAALRSLRRSAKTAVAWARLTGTPAYVIDDGKIVDIAKQRRRANHKPRGKA
jgi:hypothetical protein